VDAGCGEGEILSELARRGIVPRVSARHGWAVPTDEGSLAWMRKGYPSFRVSLRQRKMIEEVFGWVKTVGLLGRVRHVDSKWIAQVTEISTAAHNLRGQ
jgi:hypothetical protein